MIKKYRLLKDIPGVKAGEILEERCGLGASLFVAKNGRYEPQGIVESYPEFFELIKNPIEYPDFNDEEKEFLNDILKLIQKIEGVLSLPEKEVSNG